MEKLFTHFKLKNIRLYLVFSFLFYQISASAQCPIMGDSIVCASDVETYSTSMTGSYTYQWNAFGGVATGTGTSTSVSWGNTTSGQVTLVVRDITTNAVVCTSVKNIDIKSKPIPFITPSVIVGCGIDTSEKGQAGKGERDLCFSVCDSTMVTYTTPNHTGSSYTWVITGAAVYTASTTNSINVLWTGIGNGSVKVIETNSFGCIGINEICVNIVGKPTANFSSMPAATGGIISACKDQTILFNNLSIAGAGSPLYSYEWQFGDGNSTSGLYPGPGNASHAYDSAGTYTVLLIVENQCHCKDTFQMTVNVSALPGPEIYCVSTVCPGATVSYSTNAVCGTYNWDVINGVIIGDSTSSIVTVTWGSNGPGYLTLGVTGCGGFCTTPTTVLVPIITPNATISGASLVCQYDCYKYHISCDIPIDSISWVVPAGITINTDTINVHEIELCFNGSFTGGNLVVNYFHHTPGSNDGLSCGGQSVLPITVKPKLYISPSAAQICENSNYTIYTSGGTGNIFWSIKDYTNATIDSFTLPANTNLTLNWNYGAGNYIISATGTSGQYCNGTQQVKLKVNPAPPMPDSIIGPSPVCPNKPYTYLAFQTSSDLSILWDVIGGAPVNGAGNPLNVIWDNSGTYALNAFQVNPLTGCISDTLTLNINPILPLTAFSIDTPSLSCANGNSNFSVSAPGDDFLWTISPTIAGSVTVGQYSNNVTIEWNNYTGIATINVVRTACGSTNSSNVNVFINNPPAPIITAPNVTCQGTSTNISSPTTAASYAWDFGDGSTGTGASPNHVYNSAGNFVITLTVTYSGSCTGTATITKTIMVNPKPNVSISTPDPNLFCGTINNVNMYVAGPVSSVSYDWYKSPTSFLVNGNSYTGNTLGTYYVIATNSFGCKDTSNVIKIDTACDTCKTGNYTMNYTRTRLSCNTDSFSGTYSVGCINPSWNFDDPFNGNTTGSGSNVTHTFVEPGYYRVQYCVDVPNIAGTGYCKRCIYKVDTIKYVPDFYDSAYCISGIDSVKIKLINNTKRLSTLPVPAYNWLIMPGSITITAANPTVSLAAGTYTVSLTVAGVCTIVKTIVVPAFPNAVFSSNDSICEDAGILFTNVSTGTYSNITWTFGDGASSLNPNPTRVYTYAGLYVVKLKISNAFGCIDSATKNIRVLTNTLTGYVTPNNDTALCEGDSIKLTCTASGGYPGYNYLWSNIETTPSIWAKYTGSYYVDLTDSKSCFFKTNSENVIVNPVPRPEIFGEKDICVQSQYIYNVNYPNIGGYQIVWFLDGNNLNNPNSQYYYYGNSAGNHQLVVMVKSPTGCLGIDTFNFTVHSLPGVGILSSGTLCEGQVNQLIGVTNSTNVAYQFWNNGYPNDTMYTSVPGNYVYTVVDSFGCRGKAFKNINPLPDFCGMLTGCYEICDTVAKLPWFAPAGYYYQWYFNGSPISGETNQVLNIPLYQSGIYTVELTSIYGCKAMSDPIDITFVTCGKCDFKFKEEILCGNVNSLGYQTYNVTLQVFNNMGLGTNFSVSSTNGTISGLTPTVLVAGWNTITYTFTDVPPTNNPVCFRFDMWNNNNRCDTTICFRVPECETKCEKKIEIKNIDCAGFDAAGNPMYNMCVNVNWGGNNGSSLTISTASGSFVPNPVTINNGAQTICFAYTDLPPFANFATFYFTFYDPITGKVCRDSVRTEYKPCEDKCEINLYGLCAFCQSKDKNGIITYKLNVTMINPFATNATVSVLPISAGVFGTISPNPIPPGTTTVSIMFTDNLPADTIVCFRVLLSDGNKTCWKDVCIYLPPCGAYLSVNGVYEAQMPHMKIAPNPAYDNFKVFYNIPNMSTNTRIDITDITGRTIRTQMVENNNGFLEINNLDIPAGLYFVILKNDNEIQSQERLIIVK